MRKKIKVGIIGAGRIGKMHTENIVNNFKSVEVTSIADLKYDEIKDWAHGLGIKNVYQDYHDILNDPEIEAILIFSSTNSHSVITIDAAKAGKDIFCEKPIDYDLDRIYAALDAVKKAGVKFQVGFNRRFDHNNIAVKKLIEEGKIGDVHIIKIVARDPEPPSIEYVKGSGGMILDMTIHDFDLMSYLSGSDVEEVYTQAAVLVDPAIGQAGDIDTALITLKFKNGAIGVIDNSRKAVYGYDQRVEVFGSKGGITTSNDTDSSAVLSTVDGVISEKPKYFFLQRYKDSFITELKGFFDAIEYDKEILVTGEDGLKPILIALAAMKSMKESRPIKIGQ